MGLERRQLPLIGLFAGLCSLAQSLVREPTIFDPTQTTGRYFKITDPEQGSQKLTVFEGQKPQVFADQRLYIVESTANYHIVELTDQKGLKSYGRYFLETRETDHPEWAQEVKPSLGSKVVGYLKSKFSPGRSLTELNDGEKFVWTQPSAPQGIPTGLVAPGTILTRKPQLDGDGYQSFVVQTADGKDAVVDLSQDYLQGLSDTIDLVARPKPKPASEENFKVKMRRVPPHGHVMIADINNPSQNIKVEAKPGEEVFLVPDPSLDCSKQGMVGVAVVRIESFGSQSPDGSSNQEPRLVQHPSFAGKSYCTLAKYNFEFLDPKANIDELKQQGHLIEREINPIIMPSLLEPEDPVAIAKPEEVTPGLLQRPFVPIEPKKPDEHKNSPLPEEALPTTSNCLSFDADFFNSPDASSRIFKHIYQDKKLQSWDAAREFFRIMAPLARKIQEITGMPAAVFLAQAGHETGFGSHPVYTKTNNLVGHSCHEYKETPYDFTIDYYYGPHPKTVPVTCTYKRPKVEKGYYLSFNSLLDSSAAYVQNVLFNPKTEYAYGAFREAVRNSKSPINSRPFVQHLSKYATDPDYTRKLDSQYRRFNLDTYSNTPLCNEEPST